MNFVFISPQFPKTYWNFCDRLKKNGFNVLALGDTPYHELSKELICSITEYYYVPSLEDYEQVYKAMGYFIFHYGRIDYLESNNEYWLETDAKLRTDFNIEGLKVEQLNDFKSKSAMKKFYEKAGVKVARYHLVNENIDEARNFIDKVNYPVIVKPDIGVGAAKTYKIKNDAELVEFYNHLPDVQYIMEEYVNGLICSYDGIADENREIVFETSHEFPNPIMDVVNNIDHLSYYSLREIPEDLKRVGRATVKVFPTNKRCFHFEFFRLLEDKEGLGYKGEIIALEVNMRTPGGYTADMINFANDFDLYDAYAKMMKGEKPQYDPNHRPYFCMYVCRRDHMNYLHSHEEIMERYHDVIKMAERMPEVLSGAMGNQMYTAIFSDFEDAKEFRAFIHE
ncbi:MAG: carbamoylphosphate synthase large subunit [Erysipelotrichaceae bacterium]|nr:carbamoylphosphate synthase large subunit [Erysipelotrichaceae bacterium]